jgi:hypothetical protein
MKLSLPRGRIVAEFLLVVLGVLAALMVDAWIEQRHDDSLRQEYVLRLADDLETDLQNLEYRISFFTAVHALGIETLERLQSAEPVGQEALLAAYYTAEIFGFRPIENTYADLQSTGNIRLLGNIELRLALASYHSKSAVVRDDVSQDYREIVRGVIPWHIQAAIREHCPTTDATDEKPTGFPPCTLPGVSAEEVNGIFASLRAYPRIVETLTYRVSEVDVLVFLYSVQKGSVQAVLAQLSGGHP